MKSISLSRCGKECSTILLGINNGSFEYISWCYDNRYTISVSYFSQCASSRVSTNNMLLVGLELEVRVIHH